MIVGQLREKLCHLIAPLHHSYLPPLDSPEKSPVTIPSLRAPCRRLAAKIFIDEKISDAFYLAWRLAAVESSLVQKGEMEGRK
jgi:hypothetical protein